MKNKLTITFVFVATFLLATNIGVADTVKLEMAAGNIDVFKSAGLLDSLSVQAQNLDTGVLFTFSTTYTDGKNNAGAGKIYQDEFYLWNTGDIFNTGSGVASGGSMNGTFLNNASADYTIKTGGYTQTEDGWMVSFVVNYSDGYGWDDFVAALNSENDSLAIGTHLQGLVGGQSAKVLAGFNLPGAQEPVKPTTPNNTTPEPATMLIVGLGLAGLGGLAARRKRK